MGIDAENRCFPLAYAIVDVENKENWSYFFNCLRGIIGEDSSVQFTFIADRCKVSHCYLVSIAAMHFLVIGFFIACLSVIVSYVLVLCIPIS